MGFFDSIEKAVNRGQAKAERGVETMQLNKRVKEIALQRQNLITQLGASLYETTRNDEALRVGREPLYDGIAALDAEREKCLAEIAAIEEAARAAEAASQTLVCNNCGHTVLGGDMFCCSCGKRVEDIKAELAASAAAPAPEPEVEPYDGPTCPHCGAPVEDDAVFCCNCGKRVSED